MAIAIAIKPVPAAAGGPDDSGPDMPPSEAGMDIVDAAKKLGEDDLTALMQGISPEAIEVMEKIPDLAPFANFIEHGSPQEESPEGPPGNTGPMSKPTARSQVANAMKGAGVKGVGGAY